MSPRTDRRMPAPTLPLQRKSSLPQKLEKRRKASGENDPSTQTNEQSKPVISGLGESVLTFEIWPMRVGITNHVTRFRLEYVEYAMLVFHSATDSLDKFWKLNLRRQAASSRLKTVFVLMHYRDNIYPFISVRFFSIIHDTDEHKSKHIKFAIKNYCINFCTL